MLTCEGVFRFIKISDIWKLKNDSYSDDPIQIWIGSCAKTPLGNFKLNRLSGNLTDWVFDHENKKYIYWLRFASQPIFELGLHSVNLKKKTLPISIQTYKAKPKIE